MFGEKEKEAGWRWREEGEGWRAAKESKETGGERTKGREGKREWTTLRSRPVARRPQ